MVCDQYAEGDDKKIDGYHYLMSSSCSCCFSVSVANGHIPATAAKASDSVEDKWCWMHCCKATAWKAGVVGEDDGCMDECFFHQPSPRHRLVRIAFFYETQSYQIQWIRKSQGEAREKWLHLYTMFLSDSDSYTLVRK